MATKIWVYKLLLLFLIHAEMVSTHINCVVIQVKMRLTCVCLLQSVGPLNTKIESCFSKLIIYVLP